MKANIKCINVHSIVANGRIRNMWLTRRLSATTFHKTPIAINETLTISSDKFD